MATTMAGRFGCKFMHTISSLKCLTLSHAPHDSICGLTKYSIQVTSILQQRQLWARTYFGKKKESTSQESEEVSVLPKKPKYPTNVFFLYMQTVEKQILKENPGIKRTQLVKRASQMWRELDPEEKARLAMERKEMFEKYKKERKEYIENMTPEQLKEEEKKRHAETRRKLKKLQTTLGMPRKPWAPFMFYLSEAFQEKTNETSAEYFKIAYNRWTNLSPQEKEKYIKMSNESKRQYRESIEEWEKEMIEMGRYDILRKGTREKLARKE